MDNGYYLVDQGKIALGPIACDNPKSEYGYTDRRIERKVKQWAKKLDCDWMKIDYEHGFQIGAIHG